MTNDDLKKLLGGYTTGTLTEAEQKALFEAALQDQELFEALADEQPLRDVLDDPSHRAAVLAALDSVPRRHWLVRWMPALGTVAVVTVIASITVLRMPMRVQQAPIIAEMRSSGPARSIAQENAPVPPLADKAEPPRSPSRPLTVAKQKQEQSLILQQSAPAATAAPVEVMPPAVEAVREQQQVVATSAAPPITPPAITAQPLNRFADAAAANSASLAAQAQQDGVTLSATVLRRGDDGLFRASDPAATFKRGETIRLQLTSNRTSAVTVMGSVGDSRQPVFTGTITQERPLVVPVQLTDKDTKLTVALTPVVGVMSGVAETVEVAPAVTQFGRGVVGGVSARAAKRTARTAAKEDEEKPQPAPAKTAVPQVATPQPLTLDLTLKVQ